MKKQLLINIGVALFAATTIYAQSSQKLIVAVPFDFTVGNTMLQAGAYTVNLGLAPSTIALRSADGRAAEMIVSHAAVALTPTKNAKLVFNRYGDRYFLRQVWNVTSSIGREVPKSARERELAQNVSPPSREVVLAQSAK